MKEKLKYFWIKQGRSAIAPTLVVTFIFLTTYFVFGMENTMIGPFATLSFLRFKDISRPYSCMAKTFMIYIVMALAAYCAVINLPLCILINGIVLFWICAILIDEYQMNNYFPAGMALIFFQISPIYTPISLLKRIGALSAAFFIIFIFLFVLNQRKEESALEVLAREGQHNCYLLYKAVEEDNQQEISKLNQLICAGNQRMSRIIYESNRSTIANYSSVNTYCRYVGLFETFVYEALREATYDQRLKNLSELLESLAYVKSTESPDPYKLSFRDGKFDYRLVRIRFGLRQVCITMPTLVFAYVSGWENAYWLTISVFFMLIPFAENTRARVKQRVLGTLRGILFCMFLFYIFRGFTERAVIMTIFNFLIYTSNEYTSTVSYITCSALSLNAMSSGVTIMLIQRIAYTLIGAGITLVANKYVFPTKQKIAVEVIKDKLDELTNSLKNDIPTISDSKYRLHRVNECIIKAYMLGMSMTNYTSEEEAKEYLHNYLLDMFNIIKNNFNYNT